MFTKFYPPILSLFLSALLLTACSGEEGNDQTAVPGWDSFQDSTDVLFSVEGFSGPESVRYDPDQDLYFVSNFNGGGNDRDGNGFISRLSAEGSIDSLRFMTGSEENPLHAPRGMYITGDTLWAADIDGVHGFHRESGEQVVFIDFSELNPGFLNDVAAGDDGQLYITDTGTSKVYKISGRGITTVADTVSTPPNGIASVPDSEDFVLAPWGGALAFPLLNEGDSAHSQFATAESGGNFDGIEFLDGRLIASSQSDSSLHVLYENSDHILIKVAGRPADIGLDTQRRRVAVPYIALNRVDVWQLPE